MAGAMGAEEGRAPPGERQSAGKAPAGAQLAFSSEIFIPLRNVQCNILHESTEIGHVFLEPVNSCSDWVGAGQSEGHQKSFAFTVRHHL